MSWLVSLIVSGMMFASQSIPANYIEENASNPDSPQIVQQDETERFEQSYPLSPNGKVSVSNVNGSIVVVAWDKNEVKLEAVKTADLKAHLADVQIKIDSKANSFDVETDFGSWKTNGMGRNRNYTKLEVQYKLMVPRGAILDEIVTVNGSVEITGMTGSVNASVVNGNVKALNLRGSAEISTVNGVTEADFDSLQDSNKISLTTVNGQIMLSIPSDSDATIKAETVNGKITNDFGLAIHKEKYSGSRDMYGKIGGGSARIDLESVNGELSVRRKQDGKTVKTVVDLGSEDSEDAVDGTEPVIPRTPRSPRVAGNAEIARAVREANKEAVLALKDANVQASAEMARAQKELANLKVDAIEIPKLDKLKLENLMKSNELKAEIAQAAKIQAEAFARIDTVRFGRTGGAPTVDRKSETFDVKGTPNVRIDAQNCRIFVRGWDKEQVRYAAVKVSNGGDRKPLGITVDHSETSVDIKVSEAEGEAPMFDEQDQVRIEVFVPKKSNLRIRTSKEIRVEGVSGELNLTGESEMINIRDSNGKLSIETEDGGIRVIGFEGDVSTKNETGETSLEGNFTALNAQSADGTIVLVLPDNANAYIESDSKIGYEGFAAGVFKGAETKRQIGNGGPVFRLNSDQGEILIRNSRSLIAGN